MSIDLHNMQVLLSQIPRVQKLAEAQAQMLPNGSQVLNVVKEKEHVNAKGKVHDPDNVGKSEAEARDRENIKNRENNKQKKKHNKPGRDENGRVDFFG